MSVSTSRRLRPESGVFSSSNAAVLRQRLLIRLPHLLLRLDFEVAYAGEAFGPNFEVEDFREGSLRLFGGLNLGAGIRGVAYHVVDGGDAEGRC
jgi:hypothetical protein